MYIRRSPKRATGNPGCFLLVRGLVQARDYKYKGSRFSESENLLFFQIEATWMNKALSKIKLGE